MGSIPTVTSHFLSLQTFSTEIFILLKLLSEKSLSAIYEAGHLTKSLLTKRMQMLG